MKHVVREEHENKHNKAPKWLKAFYENGQSGQKITEQEEQEVALRQIK